MKISLVIPAYNEEKYISACLESVMKNGAELFEIIVIDNASTDGTAHVALGFPNVKVVSQPEKGLTKARQKGLEEATGDIIAYIDADTKMPEGWVQTVSSVMKNNAVVCVSGPYRYYDASAPTNFLAKLYFILTYGIYLLTGYVVIGGNFAAKKSALLEIGGFDETIAFYGEDTDIARRLHTVGKVVFTSRLHIDTSARRFHGEGLVLTVGRYVRNFFSIVFRKKPVTNEYKDIR